MSELIRREDALQALVDCYEVTGYAYTQMENALNEIEAVAVERECDRCMGASFGDCEGCCKVEMDEK